MARELIQSKPITNQTKAIPTTGKSQLKPEKSNRTIKTRKKIKAEFTFEPRNEQQNH